MTALAGLLFAAFGILLILTRRKAAHAASLAFGGRLPAGCMVALGIALLGVAMLIGLYGQRTH